MERGSAGRSFIKGREKAIVNQTNIATVSKATFWKLLRDGVERIWTFPSVCSCSPRQQLFIHLLGHGWVVSRTGHHRRPPQFQVVQDILADLAELRSGWRHSVGRQTLVRGV